MSAGLALLTRSMTRCEERYPDLARRWRMMAQQAESLERKERGFKNEVQPVLSEPLDMRR
jgi:hypothetical protein